MSFATPAAQGTNTVRNRKKTPMSAVNEESESPFQANGHANGHANGPANGPANGDANGHANGDAANGHAKDSQPIVIDGWKEGEDPKIDHSGHFEFGGSFGTSLLMVGFPCLMYYMWIGATYYDGGLPLPKNQTIPEFFAHLGHLVLEGAWPSPKAWLMYWGFFIFEAACYIYLPGIWLTGRPLPHEGGKQLNYYCSAVWSFYVTIAMAVVLHVSGIFKLYTIIDEFGPLLSVAILSGFLVSIVAFISALYRGAQHRMTGHLIYDFFMGAELNPRLFGILDFKMFFEVRLPWYILLLLSMGTAARQYELYGYVSGEVCFLVMAHFLYANACSKGEECIVSTWLVYTSSLLNDQNSNSDTGTCTTKNGASCLSSGTSLVFLSATATAQSTSPTTTPTLTAGTPMPSQLFLSLTSSSTGSGTLPTAKRTASVNGSVGQKFSARLSHNCLGKPFPNMRRKSKPLRAPSLSMDGMDWLAKFTIPVTCTLRSTGALSRDSRVHFLGSIPCSLRA